MIRRKRVHHLRSMKGELGEEALNHDVDIAHVVDPMKEGDGDHIVEMILVEKRSIGEDEEVEVEVGIGTEAAINVIDVVQGRLLVGEEGDSVIRESLQRVVQNHSNCSQVVNHKVIVESYSAIFLMLFV